MSASIAGGTGILEIGLLTPLSSKIGKILKNPHYFGVTELVRHLLSIPLRKITTPAHKLTYTSWRWKIYFSVHPLFSFHVYISDMYSLSRWAGPECQLLVLY